jgi:hypothetical protein
MPALGMRGHVLFAKNRTCGGNLAKCLEPFSMKSAPRFRSGGTPGPAARQRKSSQQGSVAVCPSRRHRRPISSTLHVVWANALAPMWHYPLDPCGRCDLASGMRVSVLSHRPRPGSAGIAARFSAVALVALFGFSGLLGCSEPAPPAVAPRPEVHEAPDVPTYCASKIKPCVPPQDFVRQLCQDRYASVAPYLFQKHTPYVRLHAKSRSIELKNGFNGPTGTQPVAFAEEVLLMRVATVEPAKPKATAEEVYDVLRWDGTCVTAPKRDLVTYLPGTPQAALVDITTLDTTTRTALLRDAKLAKLDSSRTAACRADAKSDGCAQAARALSDAIVAAIRQGLRLPMPRQRPSESGGHQETTGLGTAPQKGT